MSITTSALAWAASGVPVFPCNLSKRPMTEAGFYNATTDPDQIKEWFGREDVMIGGRMGAASGLFAVDFDLYKDTDESKSAVEYMQYLTDEGALPQSQIHVTAGGGLHVLYRSNGDYPNCVPAKGVEVKGEGGYIILPDSPGYEVTHEGIIQAPNKLLEILKERTAKAASGTDADFEMQVLSGQGFHDPIARLAAKRSARGDKQSDIMRYLLELLDASVAKNPQHDRHKRWRVLALDDGGELSRIVTSANTKFNPQEKTRAAQGTAHSINFDEFTSASDHIFGTTSEGKTTKAPDVDDGVWAFDGEGFDALSELSILTQKEIVAGLLVESEVLMVNGHPKSGKSILALNLAMHLGIGKDISETLRIPTAMPVLYFALEGVRATQLRIMAQRKRWKEEGVDDSNMMLFVIEKHKDFFTESKQDEVINQIVKANLQAVKKWGVPIGLVVIDTLTRAMPGGNQNDASETGRFFNTIPKLRSAGVTSAYAVVHHLRKDGETRGSTNIDAEADTITKVYRDEDTDLLTWHIDRARSIEAGESYRFATESIDLGVTPIGTRITAPLAVPSNVALATTASKVSEDTATRAKVGNTLGALSGMGIGRHDIKAVARALTAAKLIKPSGSKRAMYDTQAAGMFLAAVLGNEAHTYQGGKIKVQRDSDQAITGVTVTPGGN